MAAGWDRQGLRWVIATAAGALLAVGAVEAFQPTGPAVSLGAMPVRSFTVTHTLKGEKVQAIGSGVTNTASQVFQVPGDQVFMITGLIGTRQYGCPASQTDLMTPVSACVEVDGMVKACVPLGGYSASAEWPVGLRADSGAKVAIRTIGNAGTSTNQTVPPEQPITCKYTTTITGTLVRK